MRADSVFIDSKQCEATGFQYALASMVLKPNFDRQYINLDFLIEDVQQMCNETAENIVKAQENPTEEQADISMCRAEWRAFKYILDELKKLRPI